MSNLYLWQYRLACVAKAHVVGPPNERRVEQSHEGIRGPLGVLKAGQQGVAKRKSVGDGSDRIARGLSDEDPYSAKLLGRSHAAPEPDGIHVMARTKELELANVGPLSNGSDESVHWHRRFDEVCCQGLV